MSPQAPDDSLALAERLELGFDVLSDVDQAVVRDYRLQFELPGALQEVYRKLNMAIDRHNADGSWNLPVPATFVIDSGGIVRARHVDPDDQQRMSPDDVIAGLQSII